MTVISVRSDADQLALTLTAEFDASPERVWQLWADPRQLERWWGPPGYPTTFTAHDLRPGGKAEFHYTGPDGTRTPNVWEFLEVDPPRSIVVRDAVVDENDIPVDEGPSKMTVTVEPIGTPRTRMLIEMSFHSLASLEQAVAMDMGEGMAAAAGQIDAILAEPVLSK